MTDEPDFILLKWGTLKGWRLNKPESFTLLQRYANIGMSMGAMQQQDTPEQKQILCDLIEQHDGTIKNDWDGEEYTKEKAIDYIRNYGR